MTLGEGSAVGGMRSFHVDAGNRESSGIKRFGVGEDGSCSFQHWGEERSPEDVKDAGTEEFCTLGSWH